MAGYVNRTEQLEHAVAREIKEETGMNVSSIKFNRTSFYEPSNVLMCNFTAFVENDRDFCVNEEIDYCEPHTCDFNHELGEQNSQRI